MSYPLEGYRVLDFSRVLAGPFAGRMLSDLGADVVKVEPPEGDVTRLWGLKINGVAGYFNAQNVGKRDVCIDLSVAGAAELACALAARADVVIENFRPGVMDRLGIGYAVLAARNPKLVMLSISGFGQGGPESDRAAYAPIIHAESGVMARQGMLYGAAPVDMALSIADTNASLHGLVALLSALLMRTRTGRGQHIDMAMIDATLVTDDLFHFAMERSEGTASQRSEVWDTPAGQIIIAGDFRHIWKQLQRHCGVVDPTPQDGSLDDKIRLRRRTAQNFFKSLPDRAAVIAALDKMNLAWGDVRSGAGAADLPTVKHRKSIVQVDDRGGGTRPVVQSPYRFSNADAGVRRGAPHQGEHNADVLKDWLGATDVEIERLRAAGVLLEKQRA
jgi:crotonobetainyl-CoA:carnitine CoA-transferase CaiB-like acyl-CoA transferase